VGFCGFVGLWVCGFVGLWVCGFVGLSLCVCVCKSLESARYALDFLRVRFLLRLVMTLKPFLIYNVRFRRGLPATEERSRLVAAPSVALAYASSARDRLMKIDYDRLYATRSSPTLILFESPPRVGFDPNVLLCLAKPTRRVKDRVNRS